MSDSDLVPSDILAARFMRADGVLAADISYRAAPNRVATVSGSLTDTLESHQLLETVQPLIDWAVDVLDLRDDWKNACPALIDFQGKKGGTTKIKLLRELEDKEASGKISITTPWLDWLDSDWDVAVDEFRRAAADFIRADEEQSPVE